MKPLNILIFLLMLVIIAGCQQGSETTATLAVEPKLPATPTAIPPSPTSTPTETPTKVPTPPSTATQVPTPTITPIPVNRDSLDTLTILDVPVNDPNELAQRLKGAGDLEPIDPPEEALQVGAKDQFWVTDYNDEAYEVESTLYYVTDHAYFWFDDNAQFEESDIEKLANKFENKIYPVVRRFFGSEWTPGIDGDEHIYVLFARRLGINVGGYFSSADEMHPAAHPYSNAHEMFVLNIDNLDLADEYTYSVLAHEFQHMIHWNLDRNETTWLNEGFAQLAEELNDYPIGGSDRVYVANPDLQLNTWSSGDDRTAHYGAAFLFTAYLHDRLGDELTQAVVAHPSNGLQSIDTILEDANLIDPLTNEQINADDLVLDWVITNFVNDQGIADGRYYYQGYEEAPRAKQSEVIRSCDPGVLEFDVHQYGVDYIRFLCSGNINVRFDGSVETKVYPTEAYSGKYAFWSNKGDSSDMTLTRMFDLSDQTDSVSLTYWTWYDIEKNYDYLYVEASTDGENWEILRTPSGTDRNPSGNSYGWGYTDSPRGDEWIQESVDLSAYAGQEVYIRFEYITDAALHGEGFLIDDIEIAEIGYFTDLEGDDAGWKASGFTRLENLLPQTFRLALITTSDESIEVEILPLGINNIVNLNLDLPEEGKSVVLVVVGTTRFTRELAMYSIEFLE